MKLLKFCPPNIEFFFDNSALVTFHDTVWIIHIQPVIHISEDLICLYSPNFELILPSPCPEPAFMSPANVSTNAHSKAGDIAASRMLNILWWPN